MPSSSSYPAPPAAAPWCAGPAEPRLIEEKERACQCQWSDRDRKRERNVERETEASSPSALSRSVIFFFSLRSPLSLSLFFCFSDVKLSPLALEKHAFLRRLVGRRSLPPRAPQAVVQVGDHRPGQAGVQPGEGVR